LGIVALFISSWAAAQGKPEKPGKPKSPAPAAPPAPPAPPPAAPARAQPAVATVADALAGALPKIEGQVVVAVAAIESDAKATRAEALSALVATQLAGRRGWPAPQKPEPIEGAMVRARRAAAVVFVRPRIERGRLLVTADVHPVPATVWARVRNPSPGPVAHAFAEAPIDAEVRSFLEPIQLASPLAVTRGQAFESGVVALGCGDLDRDGALEIVSVSSERVTLVRLRNGKAHPEIARGWKDLSPMDPTPLREPVASAMVGRTERLDTYATFEAIVSISDRFRAARLDKNLELVAPYAGFAVPDGGSFSCARFEAPTITGPLEQCGTGTLPQRRSSVGGRYDAIAGASLVSADGKPFEIWAGREDGVVEIFDDAGHASTITTAGAQLAVGDLDQDGLPEILTSLDVQRGTNDAVVVYTWDRSKKQPVERLRMPVAAGVQALAVCPPDGSGRSPFLVGTPAEILFAK
jgi:hypothetical protein